MRPHTPVSTNATVGAFELMVKVYGGGLSAHLDALPRRGDKSEWRHNQDYWREREEIPRISYDAPEFVYSGERSIGTKKKEQAVTA